MCCQNINKRKQNNIVKETYWNTISKLQRIKHESTGIKSQISDPELFKSCIKNKKLNDKENMAVI